MKYLITGVAGFVGNAVSRKLLDDGHDVIGIDNINDYYDVKLKTDRLNRLKNDRFKFYKLNIFNKDKLRDIFNQNKIDCVIHLAAQAGVRYSLENPQAYIDSNITGSINMLECCKDSKIKHFLYASSSSVYGLNNKLPYSINDTVDHPVSLYASTKKSNELFAHTYSHLYRLPVTGLRFFTVYGPWGRPDMAPFIFTDAIYKNKKIKIFNNGDMWRDFTYIDDIVEATVLASRIIPEPDASWTVENGLKSASSAPYRIYNLGRGNKTNLLEFIEAIELAAGKKAIKEFKGMQPGDVVSTHADSDELYSAIEFMPKIDVNEGVQKFVDWYKLYYSR